MRSTIKVAVAGSHSTGKTTFIDALINRLTPKAYSIGRISDLATRARELGFPILRSHTYDSTLWIIAEGLRQETELLLSKDIIIIDRPIFDAVGYLEAALEVSGRKVTDWQREALHGIAREHSKSYDFVITTSLDPSIPLGAGRSDDDEFRKAAARHVEKLAAGCTSDLRILTPKNRQDVIESTAVSIISRYNNGSEQR